MKPKDFDIYEVIESLQGTCTSSLAQKCEELFPGTEEDDLTDEDYAAVDDEIFVCAQCGWRCETSEAHEHPEDGDGDVCDDCFSELRGEEE